MDKHARTSGGERHRIVPLSSSVGRRSLHRAPGEGAKVGVAEVGKAIGEKWKALTEEDKARYKELAAQRTAELRAKAVRGRMLPLPRAFACLCLWAVGAAACLTPHPPPVPQQQEEEAAAEGGEEAGGDGEEEPAGRPLLSLPISVVRRMAA